MSMAGAEQSVSVCNADNAEHDSANGGNWAALAWRCRHLPVDEAVLAFIDPRCVAATDATPLLFAASANAFILDAGRTLVAHGLATGNRMD